MDTIKYCIFVDPTTGEDSKAVRVFREDKCVEKSSHVNSQGQKVTEVLTKNPNPLADVLQFPFRYMVTPVEVTKEEYDAFDAAPASDEMAKYNAKVDRYFKKQIAPAPQVVTTTLLTQEEIAAKSAGLKGRVSAKIKDKKPK